MITCTSYDGAAVCKSTLPLKGDTLLNKCILLCTIQICMSGILMMQTNEKQTATCDECIAHSLNMHYIREPANTFFSTIHRIFKILK